MRKKEIIEELGETELLLPELVNAALLANDQVKYFMTLLQTAQAQADEPGHSFPDLAAERRAAEVPDSQLDSVVVGSSRTEADTYRVPYLDVILAGIRDGMSQMLRPVAAAPGGSRKQYKSRLNRIMKQVPGLDDGLVPRDLIGRLTSAEREAGDSLHLLVMDLHKELNAMQVALSTEVIEGAYAYLLKDKDREFVRAFMTGVNRTSPLRFDHPGLDTTATRSGNKLIIQNDIGMTDAHVLVIGISGPVTTITYTDVHLVRLEFLRDLLSGWQMKWIATTVKEGKPSFEKSTYHTAVGEFVADDRDEQTSFLQELGSRLVFLIDWNRARKTLREFLPKGDCVAALRWAADNDIGHMAFLKVGGPTLIHEALEVADPLRYREPLWEIIGRDEALEYVETVMRVSTQGLLAHRSRLLINDEIRAEMLHHFRSGHQALFERCVEQAMIISDATNGLQMGLLALTRRDDAGLVHRVAVQAKRWEGESDDIVNAMRALAKRNESAGFFSELLKAADDVMDSLEEAAFLATLGVPGASLSGVYEALLRMSELTVKAGEEYLKALVAADYLQQNRGREEMEDFLRPIDRVLNLEREADETHRRAEKIILEECTDFKQFWLLQKLANTMEESMNRFMRTVYILRDYALEDANR